MEKIFAVGDIHGCLDKLTLLMGMIEPDREKDILLFLGDYIDRGTESKRVVDYLIELAGRYRRVIFL
jgi:serine/threonine protein phosphatase 1